MPLFYCTKEMVQVDHRPEYLRQSSKTSRRLKRTGALRLKGKKGFLAQNIKALTVKNNGAYTLRKHHRQDLSVCSSPV